MKHSFALSLSALAICLTACSSEQAPSSGAPAPAPTASQKSRTSTESGTKVAAAAAVPRSVFNANPNARDPFFPKAQRTEVAETKAPEDNTPMDVPSLLQAHFQGVISSGGTAIAVINNVMLEPGRTATIPIHAAGQLRQIAVRCRDVARDSVLLEVQGHPAPLRIVRRID
jgi:hypothetical protein